MYRTCGIHLTSIFPTPSFTQNALFSNSCSGLGRGSMDQVTIGGKSISLSKQGMNIDLESEAKISIRPGQFDDAIEEGKKMFQSLAEPIKDPLKQLYEEHQSSLRHKRNDQLNLVYKGRQHQSERERGSSRYEVNQVKQFSRKKNKNNLYRRLQQTDFVAQDINWSDFVNPNKNELDQTSLEIKEEEQESLRLELEGGDYERYLSFPKSIREKYNLDNDVATSLQKVIGQNSSYKLSEKKMLYETLFQNLNKPIQ